MSKKWTLIFLLALLPTGMESIVPAPVRADDQCLEQAYDNYQECQDNILPQAAIGATAVGIGVGLVTGSPMMGVTAGSAYRYGAAEQLAADCKHDYLSARNECSSADDKSYNKPSPAKSSYPDSSYSPYEPEHWRDSNGDGSPDQSYDPYFDY
jgi:hypothetical protein